MTISPVPSTAAPQQGPADGSARPGPSTAFDALVRSHLDNLRAESPSRGSRRAEHAGASPRRAEQAERRGGRPAADDETAGAARSADPSAAAGEVPATGMQPSPTAAPGQARPDADPAGVPAGRAGAGDSGTAAGVAPGATPGTGGSGPAHGAAAPALPGVGTSAALASDPAASAATPGAPGAAADQPGAAGAPGSAGSSTATADAGVTLDGTSTAGAGRGTTGAWGGGSGAGADAPRASEGGPSPEPALEVAPATTDQDAGRAAAGSGASGAEVVTADAAGTGSGTTVSGPAVAAMPSATPPTGRGGSAGAEALSPQAAAVTRQVSSSLARMAGRGDGVHRLTLRLHPQDLGEVRITLTVRRGTVDVTLAAGPAAGQALREGSPHLRALLELTGATAGQVVVKELPRQTTGTTGNGSTFSQESGSDLRDPSADGGRGGQREGSPQHLDRGLAGSGQHAGSDHTGGRPGPGAADLAEGAGAASRGRRPGTPLVAAPVPTARTSTTVQTPSLDLTL